MNNAKTLYYITGPIGAGKSSCANILISAFNLVGIEFISADLYYYLYFINGTASESENYDKAKAYRDYKLQKAVIHKQSFIWESVLAMTKIPFLKYCKAQGYSLVGLFVGAEDYELLLKRVKNRKSVGWYDVPENKIINRYYSMMETLQTLFDLSDSLLMVDSDVWQNKLVCYKHGTNIEYFDNSCKWLGKYLPVGSLQYDYLQSFAEVSTEKTEGE